MDKEQLLYGYFANTLSPEQEAVFNKLLDTDADFREQYLFEQDLQRVIKDTETKKLKKELHSFENDIQKKPEPIVSKRRFSNWSIAASIALVMGLGWFGYNSIFGNNYENLYQANFEEYPNTVFTITRSDADESLTREAFLAYEAGNYNMAIAHFKKLKLSENKEYVDFYLGQSYLKQDNTEQAIASFKKVISANKNFVGESYWYLALTYIKKKDGSKAATALKNLIEKYDYNQDKAKNLLNAIQ